MSQTIANKLLIVLALILGYMPLRGDEVHTIGSNLQYRLSRGDLALPGEVIPAPLQGKRTLRITEGGAKLLQICRDNPHAWQEDPLLFRLGHLHAGSSIGCRERTSPSMHMVVYRRPGGTRDAWVHFDLYGPQDMFGHASEVIRNRMTFGRTSEYEVHRGLVRTHSTGGELVPPPKYDFGVHGRQYMRATFGPTTIGMAFASGAASSTMHNVTGWGSPKGSYTDRVLTNLARNAVAQSIQFTTGAFLQQEQSFSRSQEKGVGRRARAALYRSLFVPGRSGDELAFPRIAAAIGTPWVLRPWHPGLETAPDPWTQSALLFGRYIAQSYWAEFKPDITRALKKVFRQDSKASVPGNPAASAASEASSQDGVAKAATTAEVGQGERPDEIQP